MPAIYSPKGYFAFFYHIYQCPITPCLWPHTWWPINVVLIVSDFGIKHQTCLEIPCQPASDSPPGTLQGYNKKQLDGDKICRHQYSLWDLSTNSWSKQHTTIHDGHANHNLQHTTPVKSWHQRAKGSSSQMSLHSCHLPSSTGCCQCQTHPRHTTKLPIVLSTISNANAPRYSAKAVNQFLDYVATYPNAVIIYCSSNMDRDGILQLFSSSYFLLGH